MIFPACNPLRGEIVEKKYPGLDSNPSLLRTELANHLKICRRQLYSWRMSGLILHFKLGKAVRFRVADVVAAIERLRIG